MTKLYIATRNALGQVRSYDPTRLPDDAPEAVRIAALAVLDAKPKRGRGRPKGYKCSADTVARMVASRQATLAARKV